MKALILCSVFLFFAINCFASSQIYDVKIVILYTYDDYAVAKYEPETPNNENCGDAEKNDEYFVIDYTTSSHADNMHAAILSAIHTGKKVSLGLSGCYNWNAGVPKAYRIDISADQ